MVFWLKRKRCQEAFNYPENFFLGPPDFSKFTPAPISNFISERKICLHDNSLVEQTKILTSNHNAFVRNLSMGDNNVPTNVTTRAHSKSSTQQEKEEMFRLALSNTLSCTYAIFIITVGIILYADDVSSEDSYLAEIFSLYLMLLGMFYLCFLCNDIKKFMKLLKVSEELIINKYGATEDGAERSGTTSLGWSSLTEPEMIVPHHYCTAQNQSSSSLYLKAGAAVFCLGHFIHRGLLISNYVLFLILDPRWFYKCQNHTKLLTEIFYIIYSFVQLFVIVTYSNIIINKHKILARFAIMHCIGSNICFWLWMVLKETFLTTNQENGTNGSQFRNRYNTSTNDLKAQNCLGPFQFSKYFDFLSPYLFPFTIEYSILAVGVMVMMWQNVGSNDHCSPQVKTIFDKKVLGSSKKGVLAGVAILVGTAINVVLLFLAMVYREYAENVYLMDAGTEIVTVSLMIVTVFLAYKQIRKLDINLNYLTLKDNLILLTCLPAFFLQIIFGNDPSWNTKEYTKTATNVLQVIQVLIQTPYIIDGLRRCSNSKTLQNTQPGRELLMFLIICNTTLWLKQTVHIKSSTKINEEAPFVKFEDSLAWSSTFPMILYYRFHSSACMIDIWKTAYVKG